MSFKKYNSIESHYKTEIKERWFEIYPELKEKNWIAQEKLDGANISLYFENGNYEVFSRNRKIGENEDFYGIRTLLKRAKYRNLIDFFKKLSLETKNTYRVYGELFGKGIQKRINYGDDIYYRIFDLEINDKRLSPKELINFSNRYELKFLVPIYKIDKFDILIQEDVNNLKSIWGKILEIDAPIEGLVLKPYEKVYISPLGQIIAIKYKAEKFKEITHIKRKVKETGNPDVIRLNRKFRTYITENRIFSVFSKEGWIKDFSEIPKYIKSVLDDAKEDFYKDLNQEEKGILNNLRKVEYKAVFNVGSLIANKLRNFLGK